MKIKRSTSARERHARLMKNTGRPAGLALVMALAVLTGCVWIPNPNAGPGLLWQIGKADKSDREFALAPGNFGRYAADPTFIVGASTPQHDWPYMLPGPQDGWGGGKPHTATVVFELSAVARQGTGSLTIDLVDTQSVTPPLLRVLVNGHATEHRTPRGGGDASITGKPEGGRPHQIQVPIPANWLVKGTNTVEITSLRGSWVIWDALTLSAPAGTRLGRATSYTRVARVAAVRGLIEKDGREWQPVEIVLRHAGARAASATLRCEGVRATVRLTEGEVTGRLLLPAVSQEREVNVEVETGGGVQSVKVLLKPVRKMTVYVLNHSHTDIGYTDVQPRIEEKQVNNLLAGIEIARATAGNPPGSRFVWNVEVLWAADLYEHRLSPAQRAQFEEAVRKGWVSLNGLYLNMLTGLCRPEELIRTCRYATELGGRLGVKVDSAMISDVPGYTWGTVDAMAQAGIRYFSVAPNYGDRIGDILQCWENKPFWWVSQSGRDRVLVWIPYRGYAMSHGIKELTPEFMNDYQDQMNKAGYPYEIAYMRWSGHGDNAVPERQPADFAKQWNATYAWPKMMISSTGEAFAAFEKRYGDKLPEVRGDWTPYWEDGAGSSAAETALNRASSDRLAQAQTLFAMRKPAAYSPAAFTEAWNATMLYSEHTWGAAGSVSQPESTMTLAQWKIKQGYALDADKRSRALLAQALAGDGKPASAGASFDVANTCSWTRTDLVTLTGEESRAGDRVLDGAGKPVPSQRLSTGELCFLARGVPPFSARRFRVVAGTPYAEGEAVRITGSDRLANGLVSVRLDAATGAITELTARGVRGNLVDTSRSHGLNEYLYLPGNKLADLKSNGPVRLTVKERGPLVAVLIAESAAPGANSLRREVRMVAGLDRVELSDVIDKQRAPGNRGNSQRGGKESVNLAFPFAVPGGQMYLDIPFAVVRPDQDLMPSACKNWFTVGRWVEVASAERGVTWATLDAPLIQVGAITATLLGSQTNPAAWRKSVEPSQTFYVWAMNNHWHTNYRAWQEGPVTFRFALRPHRGLDLAESARFGNGTGQPLLAAPARGAQPGNTPLLSVEPGDVIVTGLKPTEDGKGYIVRLFGAGGVDRKVSLTWSDPKPASLWLSGTGEERGRKIEGAIDVPAWGLVTLRAER